MIWLAYLAFVLVNAFWLRHRFAFCQRFNDLHWQALTLIDIVAAFVIFWPLYLATLMCERPLPWATISAMAGGYALAGVRWAISLAKVIDVLFFVVTSQREHCLKSYRKWASPEGVTNA